MHSDRQLRYTVDRDEALLLSRRVPRQLLG